MDSTTIRAKFFDFFSDKGHKIVSPAPLVVKDDPSLLFTNSGMVQFKDYFLGHSIPTYKRVADSQQCLRVSGKHNDLEDVGLDTYHHTLFEMLGNWSFGDYFKKEAIAWAWELLTEIYGLEKERLYITVFGGDEYENLPVDEESITYWESIVGRDHIIMGKKKDNFWEMGETGPCGPCSEMHIDLRPKSEMRNIPGKQLINMDHPQVIELWNLVFIQFNRMASGVLENLPEKHVDTGMGFERLCRVIQHKTSNYDTDIFSPLMNFVALEAHTSYGKDEKKDIAIRVIADHARAVAFTIADGQLPSNIGAGYVVRRILRRAIRYGFSYLDFQTPFLHRIVPLLAEPVKAVFPSLSRQKKYVTDVIFEEERSFLGTLKKGLYRMKNIQSRLKTSTISGPLAFELYDTYGFPLDLTALIARERGFTVDEKGFHAAMEKQKNRSKLDATKETDDWIVLSDDKKQRFVGYTTLQVSTRILRYRKIVKKKMKTYQIVFSKTPFYPEGGGQVGDTGILQNGKESIKIMDTRKENNLIVHVVERLPIVLTGDFTVYVDANRRRLTTNNHSATHLLHAALRHVLGKHVAQRGSLVNEKGLRFDFSHFTAMKREEIDRVENLVNDRIRMNIHLNELRDIPIEQAKKMGATALFGEKYGNRVRVIIFDPQYSVELCGGTHVHATGQIGLFKLISESAIASGVRRVEAVTAQGAEQYVREELALLRRVRTAFKNPNDLPLAVANVFSEKYHLEKTVNLLRQKQTHYLKEAMMRKGTSHNGVYAIIEKIEAPITGLLKDVAYALRDHHDNLFLTLAANIDGKPQIVVAIGKSLEKRPQFHAGEIVKKLAREIEGGGGGQPFLAIAGGKKISGLENAIKQARALLDRINV